MKTRSIPSSWIGLVALALVSLVPGAAGLAQVPDSMYPEIGSPFEEKKEDTRKHYESKVALRWELSRRFSEHVIEEYQPKFLEMLKKSTPASSDRQAWTHLGGQMASSWWESRENGKTGTRPADQDDWEKQHNSFLAGIKADGQELIDWRHTTSNRTKDLQKSADEASSRFAEIRKSMAVIDPVWTKAKDIGANPSSKAWNRERLQEAQNAYADLKGKRDLARSTYGAIYWANEYATKEHGEKPSMNEDPDERDLLKKWRGAVSTYPLVQKLYTQQLTDWAKLLEAWHDGEVKAWEAMQKAFEPVKSGEIRSGSPYKDCPLDNKAEECVQKTLDQLATLIAGAGTIVAGAEADVWRDKSQTEKEYKRILELNRVTDPLKESRLLTRIDVAATDAEKKQAEKELRDYRTAVKDAMAEQVKIRDTHNARRKALGIPPEDWF